MCNQSLFNGGATYIIGEIIAKDNLNIENLMQTFENLLTWVCLIKICSNGGTTYSIGEIIAKNNLNICDPPDQNQSDVSNYSTEL